MAASMLYEQVQCTHSNPSLHNIVAALKICSSKLCLQEGRQLHAYTVEKLWNANLSVANTLIDMYSKCKSLDDGFNLFFQLKKKDLVTWNAIIGGSTFNAQYGKVLQLFEQMLLEDVQPDRVTLICTLKACASIPILNRGLQLHVYAMSNKTLCDDLKVRNTLIDMYSKCSMIKLARHVFDSSATKSIVSWNAMISGYCRSGKNKEAFDLFHEIQSSDVKPNNNTCVHVLKSCCMWSRLPDGMLTHSFIVEKGVEADLCIATALISMYSKCGALNDAFKVFKASKTKDIVIWVAMIGGYTDNGECSEALDLFERMLHHRIEPNYVAYMSAVKACTNMISLYHGRKIHGHIKKKQVEIVSSLGNALIDMYIKCGSLQDAHDVFDDLLQRDAVSWSTLIAGYMELGLFEEGFLLFKHMQKEGHNPSTVTLAYMFKACSDMNALAEGKLVHAFCVELSLENRLLVRVTLVSMYVTCQSFVDACDVFQKSSENDVVTWNAMIGGTLDYKTSFQFYSNMIQAGINPNDVTFIGLLSACSHTGLMSEGLDHFRSMTEQFGILASFEHYYCMIDLLGRVGHVNEARMLLLTMPFEVDFRVRTSLLSNCMVSGNASLGHRHM
ncbi:hypothetical protein KP509_34G024100 [Ceratopteris richardii]|uniref:Pentatricopeptide repeat-containing protein n=1 Tax=Ceratopteris richardii TaxID=49495 RepID=A0A8T2QI01_CERRI|nr:hypothetical protein KP509_34G024100 [Ceratopteris richardii]